MDLKHIEFYPRAIGAMMRKRIQDGNATNIVRSISASPWEVFLCAEKTQCLSIHYHSTTRKGNHTHG